jgi:hypothetical protein
MKEIFLIIGIVGLIALAGCSLLEKYAPSQVDENGNAIAGTHEAVQPIKDIAGSIPYGDVVVAGLLLGWNFYERVKRRKVSDGLMATVRAIKEAGADPDTKDAVEQLKGYLSSAHNNAGVKALIKTFIAKA